MLYRFKLQRYYILTKDEKRKTKNETLRYRLLRNGHCVTYETLRYEGRKNFFSVLILVTIQQ